MDYPSVMALRDAIPVVIEKRPPGSEATLRLTFDFTQLNFKWDPRKKKVTMNRGYLGEFLRRHGVTAMPPMQELMDVLANLYLLHRKQGGAPVP